MSTPTLCLSSLFTVRGLLRDRDGDGLPDSLRARLILDERARLPEQGAAVDLAARLGFETLALDFPLVLASLDEMPSGAVPVYIGRPHTLAAACPTHLHALSDRLQAGEGLVVVHTSSSLLIAGADAAGLADAAHLVSACLPMLSEGLLPETLHDLREDIGVLCGSDATPVVEALLTRQGQIVEARLRVRATAAARELTHRRLMADPPAPGRPYDVVIVWAVAGEADSSPLRLAGSGTREVRHELSAPRTTALPLRSLAGLFGPAGLSVDSDGDLLPDQPRARIALPPDLSPRDCAEAIHLAARLGLESLGLRLPLAAPFENEELAAGQVTLAIEPLARGAGEGDNRVEAEARLLEGPTGATTIQVVGSGTEERARALRALALLDASPARGLQSAHVVAALDRFLALADPQAWPCAALAALSQLPPAALYPSGEPLNVSLTLPGAPELLCRALEGQLAHVLENRAAGLAVQTHVDCSTGDSDVVAQGAYRLTWEVDEAWAGLREGVFPALLALPPAEDGWLLDVRISEPEGRREQFRQEVRRQLRAQGTVFRDEQVRVLPAYHQGRAWLLEEIAPLLRNRGVATMTVQVQHFAPPYPSLELPIRWLQDLHLADELLGARLGLPREAVRFEMADLAHTYEVEAWSSNGDCLLRAWFDVVHGQRDYLAGFPEWGQVHPPTGSVRLLVGASPLVDLRVAPDPERVWDLVQVELLPTLRAHILAATDGAPHLDDQPFFGEVQIETWLSEEDALLGVAEERVSPLESLHEDLYFMLLDYCCAVAMARSDPPYYPPWARPAGADPESVQPRRWMAPGRIVPLIHRADGAAARVRFRLTSAPPVPQLRWCRGQAGGSLPLRGASDTTLRVVGIQCPPDETKLRLMLALDGPAEACEQAMSLFEGCRTLGSHETTATGAPPSSVALYISHGRRTVYLETLPFAQVGGYVAPAVGTESAGLARVPWDRVLGLGDVEQVLGDLVRSPSVQAYQAGRSARGRACYALEVTTPRSTGLWSRARMSTWKCTLLLNARHHANEPSSTSAVLQIAHLLTQDETWRRYLDRVNVVIIPCENPDGAALHSVLQEEHPTWMHHAGRYNAAGLEFFSAYTDPNTRHTEALVLPSLWRAWTPDIVCDNHGFPSHEWIQPFSGHSNPWFQSHWISQGLIYLILPRVVNPAYASHARATADVQRRLVRILADEPEIHARNSRYADRYRTFLSDVMPESFPAPFDENVLVHTFSYDPGDPDGARASLAGLPGMYPGVTTLNLITEVADETAQGAYMELCARAHLLANRALLDYLYEVNAPAAVRRHRATLPRGATLLRVVRPRPTSISMP